MWCIFLEKLPIRALLSVNQLNSNGWKVIFEEPISYLLHKTSGRRIQMFKNRANLPIIESFNVDLFGETKHHSESLKPLTVSKP